MVGSVRCVEETGLGVSAEINALSTLMIGIVTVGVISASLISKRNAVKAQQDMQAAERGAT